VRGHSRNIPGRGREAHGDSFVCKAVALPGQWGMADVDLQALETACHALYDELGGAWDWDGRFASAVFAFGGDQADEILAAVTRYTPQRWAAEELGDAPEAVQGLVKTFGNLYPGQTFLCSDPGAPPILVAALWPWGDGQRISLRFACAKDGLDDESTAAATAIVKSCFQVG